MLRKLAYLLFGGEKDASEEVVPEKVEEEWLVVTHQVSAIVLPEATSAEIAIVEAPTGSSESVTNPTMITNLETTRATEPASEQSTVDSQETAKSIHATSEILCPPTKTLQELTELTSMKKTRETYQPKSFPAIQQRNRIRHGFQHRSFSLQQPGQRAFGH
ncbi:uncharacterized protein LOC144203414 isoform X1 [Stigmatopora nigra]